MVEYDATKSGQTSGAEGGGSERQPPLGAGVCLEKRVGSIVEKRIGREVKERGRGRRREEQKKAREVEAQALSTALVYTAVQSKVAKGDEPLGLRDGGG